MAKMDPPPLSRTRVNNTILERQGSDVSKDVLERQQEVTGETADERNLNANATQKGANGNLVGIHNREGSEVLVDSEEGSTTRRHDLCSWPRA